MVRLAHTPFVPAVRQPQKPMSDLDRLLPRLQHSIHEAEAQRRPNEFEINKLGVNIQFARSLLTTLEKEALGITAVGRRQEIQAHLNEKRDYIQGLVERHRALEEAVHAHVDEEDDEEDEESGGEDLIASYIKTPSESLDSQSGDHGSAKADNEGGGEDDDDDAAAAWNIDSPIEVEVETGQMVSSAGPEQPQPSYTANSLPETVATAVTGGSTLRSRTAQKPPGPASTPSTAKTSSRANAPAPSSHPAAPSLAPPVLSPSARPPPSEEETAEAIALRQRKTQEQISESLLQMARHLKAQTTGISMGLEADKDVLARAGKGMDATELGMDAATRRMGALRMAQAGGGGLMGKVMGGWLWEWKMYALITGLWVLLLVVVFVLPKLRF